MMRLGSSESVRIEHIHEVLVVNGRVTWLMGVGRCYSYSGGER